MDLGSIGTNRHIEWDESIENILSEIGDVESMSRQAISLLSNPALLQQYSNAAKEQAIKFDIVNIVPQYEKLYAEVLAK